MNNRKLTAVILAGGKGERLLPITESRPKPLVPVGGKPVIERVCELLFSHGIEKAVVTTHYRGEDIRQALGGRCAGVELIYEEEEISLGTAGGVGRAERWLSDPFLVIAGDCFCDCDLSAALAFHERMHAEGTLITSSVADPTAFGIVLTDESGRITRFAEKPAWRQVFSDSANTGIYWLSRSVLDSIPRGVRFDFSRDLFPAMLKEGRALCAVHDGGFWCDVGDPGVLLDANLSFAQETGDSVSGKNCSVGEGSVLTDCLLFDGVSVGKNCTGERAILCENVSVGDGVSFGRGSVIGADCVIESGVLLSDGTMLRRGSHLKTGETTERRNEKRLPGLVRGNGFAGKKEEITSAECRALGRAMAIVAEGGKCAVMSDAGSREEKEHLLAGLSEGGAAACDLGEGFERLAAFAAICLHTRLLAIVCGNEEKKILLFDEDGLFPREEVFSSLLDALARQTFSGRKIGKPPAIFSDVASLYLSSLCTHLPEKLPFSRYLIYGIDGDNTASSLLARAIDAKGGVTCGDRDAEVSIGIGREGERLIFSQGGTTVDRWHAAAILARAELEGKRGRLVLPLDSPLALESVLGREKDKIDYYSFSPPPGEEGEIRSRSRGFLWATDAPHAASRLLSLLSKKKDTLSGEEESLPSFGHSEETVILGEEINEGRLVSRLAKEKNAVCGDGVLFDYGERGRVRVRPEAGRRLALSADAYGIEAAEELLHLTRKMLKRLGE